MADSNLHEDQYEQAPNEQDEQYGEVAELQEEPRQRYKSTKGDADKRKITSKINAKRARDKKNSRIAKLKEKQAKKKEKKRYDSSESDSSDSDSEYEYALSRKKRKEGGNKKAKKDDSELIERLGNVEDMLSKMAYATKKTAKRVKRVAHPQAKPAPEKPTPAPTAPQSHSNNELLNHLKRGIIIK
jgi:hypothetical protein